MGKEISYEDAFNRVKRVIENLLQTSRERDSRTLCEITMETDIYRELGIDSLEAMDLTAAIEKEFGISVVPEEMVRKTKVKDIVGAILEIIKGG